MTNEEIKAFLNSWQDEEYSNFNTRLIPNVNKETVIGVRVPVIRKFAKQLVRENNYASFLKDFPHDRCPDLTIKFHAVPKRQCI